METTEEGLQLIVTATPWAVRTIETEETTMNRPRLTIALTAAAGFLALSAIPAFGADSGTVDARITVATPCITVSPGQIDFPTAPFGTLVSGNAAQQIAVTNCASQAEQIFARGTDATSTTSSATWVLGDVAVTCPGSTDVYGLSLFLVDTRMDLSKTNRLLDSAHPAGLTVQRVPAVFTPCSGSSGAGETMAMQYVFTAAF